MRAFQGAGMLAALLLCGCHQAAVPPETPIRVPEGTAWFDRTFHSQALGRDVTYRVIEAKTFTPGAPVRVVYLLHGNGSGYREWSRSSPIAPLALKNFVFVMPEGHSSYFLNAASPSSDRYEDFVTRDLVTDAERQFAPISAKNRAIVGVSMGGYATLVLAMHHPGEYGFAGALSPPVDAAERAFTLRRWSQSIGFRRIFGPDGSTHRAENDPFVLIQRANPAHLPFIYLSVGTQEPLNGPVERFDRALSARKIPHAFHEKPSVHNWAQWTLQMPGLIAALSALSH